MSLKLDQASVSLQGTQLLQAVSFHVRPGRMVGLLGPNGAGKTTAIRALLGLQALSAGQALLESSSAHRLTARERALRVAYLPQARKLAWPVAVREAVALGRFAYGGSFGRLDPLDAQAVDQALRSCALEPFATRAVTSLSGGELARVHLARALASQAPALIADEPTAALDFGHSLDVLALLQNQARAGKAVLVVLHDLALAARFCDEIIVLHRGQMQIQDVPRLALTPERLADVYGLAARWDDESLIITGRLTGQT